MNVDEQKAVMRLLSAVDEYRNVWAPYTFKLSEMEENRAEMETRRHQAGIALGHAMSAVRHLV